MNCIISLFLDTRYQKQNGSYPVKLRVYCNSRKKAKLYPVGIDLSEKEFAAAWETVKPRNEHKRTRFLLQEKEAMASKVAESLKVFTFEEFERKMYRKSSDDDNVFYYYSKTIEEFKKQKQFGTASNYALSEKSLKDFIQYRSGKAKDFSVLSFYDITPQWLKQYETYMVDTKGRTRTTVSMYLRALRTLFNTAIEQKEIDREIYPFGKRKYQVPATRKVKKALTQEQLQLLYWAKPQTPDQEKARDFWFFSYGCNGMNIKDIAQLRYEEIDGDKIVFYRAKTINTTKADLKPVIVYLTDLTMPIIGKYGNTDKSPKNYVFPILDSKATDEENHWKIKNFIRYINQHMQKMADLIGLPIKLSTYWARHSFATNAINNGASMEFVSEALAHNDLKTTQNYFAGFEEKSKKELMKKLMKF